MELNDIISLIVNHGLSAVVVGYFLLKDYKQADQTVKLMGEVKELMSELRSTLSIMAGMGQHNG